MRYVIADLDSTLADIDHRLPLICGPNSQRLREDADWETFFQQCVHDKPIIPVIIAVRALAAHHQIIVVTGRSDEVRKETEDWLRQNAVPFDQLIMRPAGSREADDKMKKRLIEEAGIDPSDVLIALEDRKRVVDMWRSLGIRTLQVADGDF